MLKAKIGGLVFGGLAGYLILSKGLGMIERSISNMCTAHEWKAYYKYGKDGNMVPPGYSMHKHKNEEGDDVGVGDSPMMAKAAAEGSVKKAPQNDLGSVLSDAIVNTIKNTFDRLKEQEGSLEGQTEASTGQETGNAENTDEMEVCPRNCDGCEVKKCPWENMKMGGRISAFSEDGRPIAGRYSWGDKEDLTWCVATKDESVVHQISSQAESDEEVEEETDHETDGD